MKINQFKCNFRRSSKPVDISFSGYSAFSDSDSFVWVDSKVKLNPKQSSVENKLAKMEKRFGLEAPTKHKWLSK